MKCPKNVRVLGVDVPVERSNSDQEWGSYSSNTGRISLADRGGADLQACTLLHEITHVLEVELAVDLGEKKVTRLSAGLFQVLRDNPELVAFICQGEPHERTTEIVYVDRTPEWITNATIERMWAQPNGGGDCELVSYLRLPEPPGEREDGGDEVVASGESADGGGRKNVPESGECLRDGETSCPEGKCGQELGKVGGLPYELQGTSGVARSY